VRLSTVSRASFTSNSSSRLLKLRLHSANSNWLRLGHRETLVQTGAVRRPLISNRQQGNQQRSKKQPPTMATMDSSAEDTVRTRRITLCPNRTRQSRRLRSSNSLQATPGLPVPPLASPSILRSLLVLARASRNSPPTVVLCRLLTRLTSLTAFCRPIFCATGLTSKPTWQLSRA